MVKRAIPPYTFPVFLGLLATLFLLLPWTAVQADSNYSGCGGAIVAAQNSTFEAQVAELVNQERATQGLPPMKLVPELTDAARYHAADMTEDEYFSHSSQDRVDGQLVQVCSWSARVKDFYTDFWSLGENIAMGYRTPASVMQGWMDSAGHRENILGNYTEIGVGFFQYRWVQDFGVRNSEAPLIISREAIQTLTPEVTLYVHGEGEEMRLRNDDQPWGEWQPFQTELAWTLQNLNGERLVEIEVRRGTTVVAGHDTIMLASATSVTPTPVPPTLTPIPTSTSLPTLTPTSLPTLTPTPIVLPPNMDETVFLPYVTK